ncbi:MAG: hypothetical protein ACR2NA_02780 [Solirubrobacterales bacterium]
MFPRSPDHAYAPRYFSAQSKKVTTGLDDPEFMAVASEVRSQGRTKLYYDRLYTLFTAFHEVSRTFATDRGLAVLEAGAFRGGTAFFFGRLGAC